MATAAQVTANRANAQLSTGPRSAQGKAASSRNSFRLGLTAQSMIIPGEDPAELEQLTAAHEQKILADGPIEEALLQAIVRAQWMMRRYARIEAEYFRTRAAALPEGTEYPLGAVLVYDAANGNTLQKIFRRQQAAEREWRRAVAELRTLQAGRRHAEAVQSRAAAAPAPRVPVPHRVRFDNSPEPSAQRAPEPPANLALRL